MNMLVFADRYQDEVAGVALVDSAHPDQVDRLLAVLPTPASNEPAVLNWRQACIESGWICTRNF